MTAPTPGLIDSVRARLRNVAGADGARYQAILERYAIERLLYRIASSHLRDRFVLKGATLFLAWGGDLARPTRDLDLLSFGRHDVEDLITSFRTIVATPVEADGLVFPSDAIKGAPIKVGQKYEGVRLAMLAMLGKVRIPVQVDVGFGDAVEPEPLEGLFPTLLDLPAPHLRLYPREVVVAEKFHRGACPLRRPVRHVQAARCRVAHQDAGRPHRRLRRARGRLLAGLPQQEQASDG